MVSGMATSPTVRRRRLAAELKRLREVSGMTLEDAAAATEVSRSTLSRIENAQVGPKVPIVRALLLTYGVQGAPAEALLQLSRQANQRSWWQPTYGSVVQSTLGSFLDLEQEATQIREYSTVLLPGLLQTEAYARDVLTAFYFGETRESVDTRLKLRLSRQALLNSDTTRAWFIFDEGALRRRVGGPEVMRQQLAHLLDVGAAGNVTVQVLPYDGGAYPTMGMPFVVFDFREDPSVVFLENATSGLYLEEVEEARHFQAVFDHLRASAASIRDSAALIQRVLEETP
jgi:transcriptional regulator with XRE-family HTH domain